MSDELKPCAHCGHQAKLELTIIHVTIKCVECRISFYAVITDRRPNIDYFKSLAIGKWNTRTGSIYKYGKELTELDAKLAELQAKYDIALKYIKSIHSLGNCHCLRLAPQLGEGYHHVACRWRAEQILKELGE